MMKRPALFSFLFLLLLGASPASSLYGLLTVNSVDGTWTSVTPGGSASGVGTNEIRWGTPTGHQQSGYRFDGFAPPAFTAPVGTPFDLGEFTHFNFPITGSSIDAATLDISLDLDIHGTSFEDVLFTVLFNHDETPNSGPNPDDIVSFVNPNQSQALVIGGDAYLLEILGFEVGGQLVNDFFTQENRTNQATLIAQISHTAVPEPSTYLLLGTLLLLGYAVKRKHGDKQTGS